MLPLSPAETLARKVALGFAFDFGIVEAAAAVTTEGPAEGVVPQDKFIRAPMQTPQI